MTEIDRFISELRSLDIENVYIYVGDAVRWDFLSAEVADLGTVVKTLAASTTSAPSFSSLLTGLLTTSHNVHTFKHQLSSDTFRMLDVDGFETEFLNSIFEFAQRDHEGIDPIYPVLGIRYPDNIRSLAQIESPFLYMERGPGGHLPYGDYRSTATYFERSLSPKILREDYKQSIELDAEFFKDRMKTLQERGTLDDTLVVYTSDHGELLGEYGLVGHNSPMCPELVYVPTVFIHKNLPKTVVESPLFEHVSLLPTILSVIGVDGSRKKFDGSSILDDFSDDPSCSIYQNEFLSDGSILGNYFSGSLKYEGVWDASGGYVFPRENALNRLFVLAGKLLKSPKRLYLRNHLGAATRSYLRGEQTFGDPEFSKSTANNILEELHRDETPRRKRELSEQNKEELQDLGYL